MKVLKILASVFLGCLLFLCLLVLGLGISLNSTLLSRRFVDRQIDRLDVVGLVDGQVIPRMESDPELSKYPGFISSVGSAVTNHQAEVKRAVELVVDNVYGYVVGSGHLDLMAALEKGLLDPKLSQGIINDLDLAPVVTGLLPQLVPDEASFVIVSTTYTIDLKPYREKLTPVVQRWFKQQASSAVPVIYNYLLGKTGVADINFSTGTLINDIYTTLKQAFVDSPPPQAAGLSPDTIATYFDTGWTLFSPQIPVSMNIDTAEELGAPGVIPEKLKEIQPGLDIARHDVNIYHTWFAIVAGLAMLLTALIILVNRSIRVSCRALGIILGTYGIIVLAGVFIAYVAMRGNPVAYGLNATKDVPAALYPWLLQMGNGIIRALLVFPALCAVSGIGLLILSFIYRGSESVPG